MTRQRDGGDAGQDLAALEPPGPLATGRHRLSRAAHVLQRAHELAAAAWQAGFLLVRDRNTRCRYRRGKRRAWRLACLVDQLEGAPVSAERVPGTDLRVIVAVIRSL